jgi:NTP pyrophosphatase (non-canonical NTP hydrolase)
MTWQDYENLVRQTHTGDKDHLPYPALGIAGEAGEVVEKIKKLWRNDGLQYGYQLNQEQKDALTKELGDVLWYVTAIAMAMGVPLEQVAAMNMAKLLDRKERGVVKSEGDNR